MMVPNCLSPYESWVHPQYDAATSSEQRMLPFKWASLNVWINPLSMILKAPYESPRAPKQTGSLLTFFQFSEREDTWLWLKSSGGSRGGTRPRSLIIRPNWGPKSPPYLRAWMTAPSSPSPYLKAWLRFWNRYLRYVKENQEEINTRNFKNSSMSFPST